MYDWPLAYSDSPSTNINSPDRRTVIVYDKAALWHAENASRGLDYSMHFNGLGDATALLLPQDELVVLASLLS
ncbi:hypothetical protein J6590_095717 [Homalodisca vitripennis]|nr:hypothetical protein J6590_095717 [Homalodisca vitripennis]